MVRQGPLWFGESGRADGSRVRSPHLPESNSEGRSCIGCALFQSRRYTDSCLTLTLRLLLWGRKVEIDAYLGVFDHLNLDALLSRIRELEWEETAVVQLLLKEEGDLLFHSIEVVNTL